MIFKGTVYRRSSSDRPRQPEVAGGEGGLQVQSAACAPNNERDRLGERFLRHSQP